MRTLFVTSGCVALTLFLCMGALLPRALIAADAPPDFERDVAPLLMRRCLECHNATETSGGLDLRQWDSLQRGGESGPAIDRDKLDASLILARVTHGEMPPAKNGKSQALTAAEQEILARWIRSGAAWPADRTLDPFERSTEKRAGRDWWSLQRIARPDVPPEADTGLEIVNAIDAFVSQKLARHGMRAAVRAEPRQLLRRLSYDLIGLPPTAEQLDAFESNPDEDAYQREVDRLLMRPEFGQRWARYWLDVVRFAETNGYERDAVKPHAWRYRDWVVDALNNDLPYDRFLVEQLAGDELPDRRESSVIATGFLRLGTWDDEPNDPQEYQYDRLEDLVHATSTAFMGLTVKCARCHDHKFDPIPQTDYYRMAAAFWAGPVAHRKREWNGGPNKEELGFDVLGWTDLSPQPPELKLLKKGDVRRPGETVAAGTLSGPSGGHRDFESPPPGARTSQRRLQLAAWLVEPSHPLTARVQVNRIWQRLFGEGLVRTPDNFGFQGTRPTHPELLDWLAAEFIDSGWHQKRLIKTIVLSGGYRQSSLNADASQYEQRDPSNHFLWRANRRRLDAEALRDSILFVSGRLDFRMGGESFRAPIDPEALEGLSMKGGAYKPSPAMETMRRSLYMFAKRSLAVPLMTVFDCCDTTAPAGRRDVTIVPPQALTLLNNTSILEESRAVAERVLAMQSDRSSGIEAAWLAILARRPRPEEQRAAEQFLNSANAQANPVDGWSSLCHVLINTNEFIYVD